MGDVITSVRRSRTARLEAGDYALVNSTDATPPQVGTSGWTTALEGGVLHTDDEEAGAHSNILPPNPVHATSASTRMLASGRDRRPRSAELPSVSSSADARTDTLRKPLPRHVYQHREDSSAFEPVADLPGLPRLDFLPLTLQKWVLCFILAFHLAILGALGTLVYYQDAARIFHVTVTTSRFAIYYLPGIVGAVSTTMLQAVGNNLGRMIPFIRLAESTGEVTSTGATAARTLLAVYFPEAPLATMWSNSEWTLLCCKVIYAIANLVVVPLKGSLLIKQSISDAPRTFYVTTSRGTAFILILMISAIFCMLLCVTIFLWDRRTGLKWDPVSLADSMMLFAASDSLVSLDALEIERLRWNMNRIPWAKARRLSGWKEMLRERHRLGYWLHKDTGTYWHGIRRVLDNEKNQSLHSLSQSLDESPELNPSEQQRASDTPHSQGNHAVVGPEVLSPTSVTVNTANGAGAPSILPSPRTGWTSESPDAYLARYNNLLSKPNLGLKFVYGGAWRPFSLIMFAVSFTLSALGLWFLISRHFKAGFTVSWESIDLINIVFRTLPGLLIASLFNILWTSTDIHYRMVQPFMGLRQPHLASENLLLGYLSGLPGLVTVQALSAKHWRLAVVTVMPLVQKAFVIFVTTVFQPTPKAVGVGAIVTVDRQAFLVCWIILITYTLVIPWSMPGLSRRLPWFPSASGFQMLYLHDSHVLRSSAFAPISMLEDRWQMIYRLLLEEKKYAFRLFLSPDRSCIHLGIDEAYISDNGRGLREPLTPSQRTQYRAVAPLLPPERIRRRHPGAMLVSCMPFLSSGYEKEMQQEAQEATAARQRASTMLHAMIQYFRETVTPRLSHVSGHSPQRGSTDRRDS